MGVIYWSKDIGNDVGPVMTYPIPIEHKQTCDKGCKNIAELIYIGYSGEKQLEFMLCRHCALQLARIILEDLCHIDGDRHG